MKAASPVSAQPSIDVLPVATIVCDAEGRVERFNQRAVELLGSGVVPGWDVRKIFDAGMIDDLLRTERRVENVEVVLPQLRGDTRTVLAAMASFRASGGKVRGLVASFVDITEHVRKRGRPPTAAVTRTDEAEAAHERTATLQSLTSALSIASTPAQVAAAAVQHSTRVFSASGTIVARITSDGRQLEIVDVMDLPDRVREAWQHYPIDARSPLADVARTGTPIVLESRKDWATRYPDLMPVVEETGHHANIVVPLVVEGRTTGAMGIAFREPHTFTEDDRNLAAAIAQQAALALERARLFESVEHARQRADEANFAKTQFLATMSHELRTPLNAIGGYADILALGIHGPVTPAQLDSLERILRNQQHLSRLINDVLNFAKIESGHIDIEIGDVDVSAVCHDVEALVAPQLRAKGIRDEYRCPPGILARADDEKVRQILINLLANAIKFSDSGSSVEVETQVAANHVMVRVKDSGVGIPPGKLRDIFEPFVQLGRNLSSRQEGAGLGLAISRNLARLMDGDLTVESQPGMGSVFTLVLPRAS